MFEEAIVTAVLVIHILSVIHMMDAVHSHPLCSYSCDSSTFSTVACSTVQIPQDGLSSTILAAIVVSCGIVSFAIYDVPVAATLDYTHKHTHTRAHTHWPTHDT